ncbi:hypothetical protein KA005_40665 [bacterium]|nr:hypothetical protein [bacterium]
MKRAGFFIGAVLLLICMRGCVNPFAPGLTSYLEGEDYIVTPQQSPEEVLQNFKVAYIFQDSLLYSNLLDTAFVFVYFDPDEGTSGRFVSWGRETDLMTTGGLFRHFQVVDLVWNTTFYSWIDEKAGEVSKGFNLTLIGKDSDYRLFGKAVFSFQKCNDEKWRITRWKDESDL